MSGYIRYNYEMEKIQEGKEPFTKSDVNFECWSRVISCLIPCWLIMLVPCTLSCLVSIGLVELEI